MKNQFLSKIKYAEKYLLGKEFHSEHFDAAIEVLDIMASKDSHTNHIILDAPTQSGKTSVMEMVYRILNFEQTYKVYGIENVIYMTADNGSGEGSLKLQTANRFKNHWKNYVHSLPIEFLKRSDFDRFTHIMKNTLIMVDESQYGWREVYSKGQRLLQINGVNFCSVEELEEKNTYILSVSATTQNERYGDSPLKLKPIVKLKPGNGYIGFYDFFNANVVKPVLKDEFIDDYTKLDNFLEKQRKKLNTIYKNTGVAKCVIIRLFDNKKNDFIAGSEEFEDIVEKNGFIYKLISSKDSKIDYKSLQSNIFYNCNDFSDNGNKFYLVVIKYAFSYGITIEPKIKKLISTCYDVRKDINSTEATEQGLLGRMSGYGFSIEDFEDLEIYINETHYNGIKNYINGLNEYSVATKVNARVARVKCEKNKWNGDEKYIDIFNNENKAPMIFEGKIVDDFVKKHYSEFDFETVLKKEKMAAAGSSNSKIKSIAIAFLKENGLFEKMHFDEETTFDFRRKVTSYDACTDRICASSPIITTAARRAWRTEKNAEKGAICWGAVLDITNLDEKSKKGLVIKIPYGKIGFSCMGNIESVKQRKMKKWPGYDTSATNKTLKIKETII